MKISSQIKKTGWYFPAMLAGIFLAATASIALAQNNAGQSQAGQLASLEQDVQGLERQVQQLSSQVDTLQKNNDDLQKQILTQHDVQVIVDNAVAKSRSDIKSETDSDITKANSVLRKEVVDEVAKQIDALTKDFNAQLQKLADVIRTAPPAPVVAPTRRGAEVQTTFSDDFPKGSSITYKVQPGDTLAKIAQKYNSTVQWIQNANKISDPKNLPVGKELYIPQKDSAAGAPAPSVTPVSSTAPGASGQ